jgi:putative sugar O-methyltransferase
MTNYPELDLAWNDMQHQSSFYKPTSFWAHACTLICKELATQGIENFRQLPTALGYFVPTYGPPGNNIDPEFIKSISESLQSSRVSRKSSLAIEQFFSGELHAMSDYRVLLAADDQKVKPWLHQFSECSFGNPVEQFCFGARRFSRSSLNYLLGLAMLKRHLDCTDKISVLEIGGGFGTLGEILAQAGFEEWHYVDIDVPPNSFVAERYLSAAIGKTETAGYGDTCMMNEIKLSSLPNASVLCPWQIEKLSGNFDLFVNFISFQEMEPFVVANYLAHVDRLNARWVLLRNMREGKQLRTAECAVGVETPITTDSYISFLPKYELVQANVVPFGFRTVDGFHSELLLFRRRN